MKIFCLKCKRRLDLSNASFRIVEQRGDAPPERVYRADVLTCTCGIKIGVSMPLPFAQAGRGFTFEETMRKILEQPGTYIIDRV